MYRSVIKINFYLLRIGFLIANLLWIKALFDINTYNNKRPDFHFPGFFSPLFIAGAVIFFIITCYMLCFFRRLKKNDQVVTTFYSYLLWASIPVASYCNSLVEYNEKISVLISYFPVSTVLRIILFITPLVAGVIYFTGKKNVAVFILLCLCFLIIIPNNRCFNPFNYWWLDKVGASPLTYLPTMITILFVVSGLYGLNKYISIFIVFMLIISSLFISFGHITKFLW